MCSARAELADAREARHRPGKTSDKRNARVDGSRESVSIARAARNQYDGNRMKKHLVFFAAASLLALAALSPARAAWPERPVRIVVGFPAGSTGDVIAR